MERVGKFFRKYPELISIPLALAAWRISIDVLRWFDGTAGIYDGGVFQIPIFAVIQFFLFISMAWLTMKLLFGTIRKYLKTDFKKEFKNLTEWQRILVSYGIFFGLLFVLALLAQSLHA